MTHVGEVAYAWHAKEAVRFFYDLPNSDIAEKYLTELAADLQDDEFPIEVRSVPWPDTHSLGHRDR